MIQHAHYKILQKMYLYIRKSWLFGKTWPLFNTAIWRIYLKIQGCIYAWLNVMETEMFFYMSNEKKNLVV